MEIREFTPADGDELFEAFSGVVERGEGFPQQAPLTWADFTDYWIAHSSAVMVAIVDGHVAGAYYVKPNFVGRAAHIANAGYFVVPEQRGRGIGRALVVHSLEEAARAGFDAMQFNLVFESNPARALYEELGFRQLGLIPRAVEGENAVIYWRALREGSAAGPQS